MDKPTYSDPIVIPVTLTIPDPRPQPSGDRFNDGPVHHPSVTDPGWFTRNYPPSVLAQARFAEPMPFVAPLPVLPSVPDLPSQGEIDAEVERARRRAQEIKREAENGEVGSAAGHLLLGPLLGFPYPAEGDDPGGTIVHIEGDELPVKPDGGRKTLKQMTDETERNLEKRREAGLDERHLQDAENDRREQPVTRGKDGHGYDHENEVARSRRGLGKQVEKLQKKLEHEQRYGEPRPSDADYARADAMIKKFDKF